MDAYAALLRGVNVGGHHKIPMADLREALTAAGLRQVRTYIQSGNVVFATGTDPAALPGRIRAVVGDRFGFDIAVAVRSRAELDALAATDPFAGRGLDPAKVTVSFLERPLDAAAAAALSHTPEGHPEEAHAHGAHVWVYYPDGMGRSRLDRSGFWKPLRGNPATARNRRTLDRLRAMAADVA